MICRNDKGLRGSPDHEAQLPDSSSRSTPLCLPPLLLTVEETCELSSESRADTLNTRPLWDQPGNQNLLFLPLLLSGWVSSRDMVPICPSAQPDPTEAKTKAQGQKVALSEWPSSQGQRVVGTLTSLPSHALPRMQSLALPGPQLQKGMEC